MRPNCPMCQIPMMSNGGTASVRKFLCSQCGKVESIRLLPPKKRGRKRVYPEGYDRLKAFRERQRQKKQTTDSDHGDV